MAANFKSIQLLGDWRPSDIRDTTRMIEDYESAGYPRRTCVAAAQFSEQNDNNTPAVLIVYSTKDWTSLPKLKYKEVHVEHYTYQYDGARIDKLLIGKHEFFHKLHESNRNRASPLTPEELYKQLVRLCDTQRTSYHITTDESGIEYIPELMELIDVTEPFIKAQLICPLIKETVVTSDIYSVALKMSAEEFRKSGAELLTYLKDIFRFKDLGI